ncbi:YafY family protein [Paenibacillus sp. FJAT-26967]|uniref:helix-turn-helix transcriptional regulator n=1 Tax=Paenibacillus sp. FJAT-26967 TaxID=1729690 RepID=UPI0008393553|nr:HTH domain-containing protein [Paenibacillus sp. FJAT-26967]
MIRNRQIEILLYLLKVKKTTHEELANIFEVSIKTIQRDVDKLSMMGVPVTCKQGNQGGVYIDENYKLSRSFFDNEDLLNITFALSVYDSISTKKHKDSIMKKLALIAPDLVYLFAHDSDEYFVVDILNEKIDMTEVVYKNINHCFDEEYCLSLSIDDKSMVVAPISYVLRSDGLYLYALDEKYILIKISDIQSSQVTDVEFERNFIPYKKNKKIHSK